MAVPNTTTFNFQDVTTAVYGDTNSGRNLVDAFADADAILFDSTYSGSKNSLYNFRNYGRYTSCQTVRWHCSEDLTTAEDCDGDGNDEAAPGDLEGMCGSSVGVPKSVKFPFGQTFSNATYIYNCSNSGTVDKLGGYFSDGTTVRRYSLTTGAFVSSYTCITSTPVLLGTNGSTSTAIACLESNFTTRYTDVSPLEDGVSTVYTDTNLTTTFNGGNKWFKYGIGRVQIGTSGTVDAVGIC